MRHPVMARFIRARAGFGQEQSGDQAGQQPRDRKGQVGRGIAALVGHIAAGRRGNRRRQTNGKSDDAHGEVEPAPPARDIGDDQWHHDADGAAGDAVKRLENHQQIGVAGQREQQRAGGQRGKSDQQNGAPAHILRRTAEHGRQPGGQHLRNHDRGSRDDIRALPQHMRRVVDGQRKQGRIAKGEQRHADGENEQGRIAKERTRPRLDRAHLLGQRRDVIGARGRLRNVGRANPTQGRERGERADADQNIDRPVRIPGPNRTHAGRRAAAADRREPDVQAQPLTQLVERRQ